MSGFPGQWGHLDPKVKFNFTKFILFYSTLGEQGDPGVPGVGRPGVPGTFEGLTEQDLARIAAWPGVKVCHI